MKSEQKVTQKVKSWLHWLQWTHGKLYYFLLRFLHQGWGMSSENSSGQGMYLRKQTKKSSPYQNNFEKKHFLASIFPKTWKNDLEDCFHMEMKWKRSRYSVCTGNGLFGLLLDLFLFVHIPLIEFRMHEIFLHFGLIAVQTKFQVS